MMVSDSEPWRALPPEVADVLAPERPVLRDEILRAIGEEVPEYARPLAGEFGRAISLGVDEALRQFVDLVREPDRGRAQSREVYLALGRGEMRQGRSLDALQAAYRVGARTAWRHNAGAGLRAGLSAEVLCQLADSIFAYIDELAADSVEGYALAQQQEAGAREGMRRRLVSLMISGAADEQSLAAAAAAARWRVPREVALLACDPDDARRIARQLPPDAISASLEELGCVLIADPAAPGARAGIEAACAQKPAAVGPVRSPAQASRSWQRARLTLEAMRAGALESGCVWADEHLAELALFTARETLADLAAARLAPLASLSPLARERMELTLAAYIDQRASAPAMASALAVHPQTARYRLRQLRELFGDALEDPSARFELSLALRGRSAAAS